MVEAARPGVASPVRAFAVVTAVVLAAATLVSAAVVLLRPLQVDNRMLRQGRVVLALAGDPQVGERLSDREVVARMRALDARVADLDQGRFTPAMDPYTYDSGRAAENPDTSAAIPAVEDLARLGRRARHAVVYLVWGPDGFERMILPVHGQGMWSTIRGFVALEKDLNTIAGAVFHEQAETPGVGDRITGAEWLAKWRGRKIYDEDGAAQFAVAAGRVEPGSAAALYQVDGLSGATVTGEAVTAMVRFWFGPWGYRELLNHLRAEPPARPVMPEDSR